MIYRNQWGFRRSSLPTMPCSTNRVFRIAWQGNYICQTQSAITDAELWATSWHGKFGHAKTKVMCISSKSLPIPQCIGPFFIDGTTVSVVDSHCHLGVSLVNTLDWSDHIRSVIKHVQRKPVCQDGCFTLFPGTWSLNFSSNSCDSLSSTLRLCGMAQ